MSLKTEMPKILQQTKITQRKHPQVPWTSDIRKDQSNTSVGNLGSEWTELCSPAISPVMPRLPAVARLCD